MSSTDLLLRRAVEEDAAAIAAVHLAARRAGRLPTTPRSEEDLKAWVAAKLQGYDETWVAELDGTVVGYARIVGDWLGHLYVAPSHAGQGVGSALLDVVKALRPDGFSLWVFEMNHPARRFYTRHGLVEGERTDGTGNEEGAPDIRVSWPGHHPGARPGTCADCGGR